MCLVQSLQFSSIDTFATLDNLDPLVNFDTSDNFDNIEAFFTFDNADTFDDTFETFINFEIGN